MDERRHGRATLAGGAAVWLTLALAAGAAVAAHADPASAATDVTVLVSRASGTAGAAADDHSYSPVSVSGDGRFVAFASVADNLSDQDDNANGNVFVRDLQTGTTVLAGRADGVSGAAADAGSSEPSISSDGRYVAFVSSATNLSSQDNDVCAEPYYGQPDRCANIFVRDLQAGTTTYVSRADGSAGAAANGSSFAPAISADGRRVVFTSVAANLSGQDVNDCVGYNEGGAPITVPCFNTFVRDLATGTTTYAAPGLHTNQGHGCGPAISADGRYVAVETDLPLSGYDTNEHMDVYVVEPQTGATSYVSRADGADGAGGRSHSYCPSISGDGGVVGFESYGGSGLTTDPVRFDLQQVYARDLAAGSTTLLSRADGATGEPASWEARGASVSADGRHVAFHTNAANLSPSGSVAVFVRDRLSHTTRLMELGYLPAISGNGLVVGFESTYDSVSDEDNDAYRNVYVRGWDSVASPPGQADLSLSMTVSNAAPTVGTEVTFTVTAGNAGALTASGVAVTDRLPAGLSLSSATVSQGSYAADTGVWLVGSLATGATATLRLVAKPTAPGAQTNTAQVSAVDQPDPDSTPGNSDPAEDDQASVTVNATAPSCGSVRVTAAADAWIAQNAPATNFGKDSALRVRSKSYANARTLVRFALPAVPAGCKVTGATLRLYAAAAAGGRTLRVSPLTATWSEGAVTWSNRPAGGSGAAYASSRTGWTAWSVTTQVTGAYAGPLHGFLVRDATEGGAGYEQRFHSRENGINRPELVITFRPA
ncbi:MAG: DUF7594 domain-containing protein [Micromonosporaceae bacterium]